MTLIGVGSNRSRNLITFSPASFPSCCNLIQCSASKKEAWPLCVVAVRKITVTLKKSLSCGLDYTFILVPTIDLTVGAVGELPNHISYLMKFGPA